MKKQSVKIGVIVTIIFLISIMFQIKGSSNEHNQFVNENLEKEGLPRLIDFGSDCPTCASMIPILIEIKEQYKGKLIVEMVDVYQNPERTSLYNIMAIPTQVFLDKDGIEVYRNIGLYSVTEIRNKLKELGIEND